MKPLFILGMGAQKAGTSWLHKTLAEQTNVNLGFMKEYHVWDYVFSDVCKGFKAPLKKPDNAVAAMRRLMQESPQIYAKYFQSLISSDVNTTGDITPSYAIINEPGLKKIASTIKDAGFDLKVVFLMRDPVERIWSAVRMEKRERLRKGENLDSNFLDSKIKQYISSKGMIARSDYKTTVRNITKVFSEDEIHFALYERLFDKKGFDSLQDFLGFELKNVNFSERVNASEAEPMSEEITKMLMDFLSPQYQFCNERFEDTKEVWRRFEKNHLSAH